MKMWNECAVEVGFDRFDVQPPPLTYKFYAYKGGKAFECESYYAAAEISKHIEKFAEPLSKATYDNFWERRRLLEVKANEIWYAALQEEFSELPVKLFQLCYSRAYEDAHGDGRDSVYYKMGEYVEFAEEVLKAKM